MDSGTYCQNWPTESEPQTHTPEGKDQLLQSSCPFMSRGPWYTCVPPLEHTKQMYFNILKMGLVRQLGG